MGIGTAKGASDQVPFGSRAIALGGAFSALADDGTALFWNPAGLARIGHQELFGGHADLFGSGIRDDYAGFVLPLSTRHAVGIDWYRSGFDDGELQFGENRIDFAYARSLGPMISVGATAKYFSRNSDLDGFTIRRGSGIGLDAGVLANPIEPLRLAIMAHDVSNTRIEYDGGGSTTPYPRSLRAAASGWLGRRAVLAFDVDDRWHVGTEVRPIDAVALRAGAQKDRTGGEDITWSYGLGFRTGLFRIDYAREVPPVLGATDHFTLGMEFNFNPALIRVERVNPHDFYGAFYQTYTREGFGNVFVRNLQNQTVEAKVRIQVPGLTDHPYETEILLRPRAVTEVPLTAVFSSHILQLAGDRNAQALVSVTYQSRHVARTEKASGKFVVYRPGAIDWNRGVEQAAAFVAAEDPTVDQFAREASRLGALLPDEPFDNDVIRFTASIVNALAAIGMTYVPDPNNPFSTISETPHAVDTVDYPAETLARRSGDCDDTTILLAALLENVGISTRFVDAPGHLFLLAGTAVPETQRLALGFEDALFIALDGEFWIPLETTLLRRGFLEVWRAGADQLAGEAQRRRLAFVDVETAQQRWIPVGPADHPNPPSIPADSLLNRLRSDAQTAAAWKKAYEADRYGSVPQPVLGWSGIEQVAHVYVNAGRLDEARRLLLDAHALPTPAGAIQNDVAVTWILEGRADSAWTCLSRAVAEDPAEASSWLNLGLVRLALGDTAAARPLLARAIRRQGGLHETLALLGLGSEQETAGRANSDRLRVVLMSAGSEAQSAQNDPGLGPPPGATMSPGSSEGIRPYVQWRR